MKLYLSPEKSRDILNSLDVDYDIVQISVCDFLNDGENDLVTYEIIIKDKTSDVFFRNRFSANYNSKEEKFFSNCSSVEFDLVFQYEKVILSFGTKDEIENDFDSKINNIAEKIIKEYKEKEGLK